MQAIIYTGVVYERLISLLCVLFFCLNSHVIYAQNNQSYLLEKRVTIHTDGKRLIDVMGILEKQAAFRFSYASGLVDENKLIILHFNERPLREVLNQLFAPELRFRERNEYIILSRVPSNEKKVIVSGYVRTPDGNPVQSATVYDSRSLVLANTNKYGYYEMKIEKRHPVSLQVSKKDFNDTISPIVPSSGTLHNHVISPKSSKFRQFSDSLRISLNQMKDNLSNQKLFPERDSIEEARRDSLRQIRIKAINDSLSEQWSRFKYNVFLDSTRTANVNDTIYRDFQVSLLPYVSTNRKLGPNCINEFSFNIIAGYSMGLNGFELGGLANLNRYDVRGAQIAGFTNMNGGRIDGFQIGGFANLGKGSLNGGQIAGFANLVGQDVKGIQIGGFANVVGGDVRGVQIGGFSNVNLRSTKGIQIAGFSNTNLGDTKGIQLAGFSNVVTTQMKGIQIAGFLNYSKKFKGVMIAPFNVADTLNGIPIGFLSFVKTGYHTFEVSSNDIHTANVSFRTGVRGFYNVLSGGMNFENPGSPLWTYGYGIGSSPRLGKNIYLNADLVANHISSGRFNTNLSLDNQFYLGLEWQIAPKFSISAGGILHGYFSQLNKPSIDVFSGSTPRFIHDDIYGETRLQSWIGWKVGLRFF